MVCLATACLLAKADNKPTLTVDGTTVDRNWVSVSFDEDTWEVDMASVAIAFSYEKEETPTSIAAEVQNAEAPSSVFDLQGRRVASQSSSSATLKKGIYIRNGKKVIVK